MIPEQREALDEIVLKMRAGRISRRRFLERAISIGLTSSVTTSLLEACGGTNAQSSPKNAIITWESDHEPAGVYDDLVQTFNKTNREGIHVVYINGPVDSGQLRSVFVKMLQAHSGHTDVMSMDIIWPAEFASNRWTLPIDSKWTQDERAKYLPGPIKGCTFNGHIWAAPHHVDVGLIYFRKDLMSSPPDTWDELATIARKAQEKVPYGYVWQGAKYEGLVCNFVEVLYGYGGAILAPDNPKKVIVNSPEAQQALSKMVGWVGTISPLDVTVYKEEDVRTIWQNKRAAFMRNWPYAYVPGNDPSVSQVAGKFDIHSMLSGGNNTIGHSCIGGWQLGINAYSKYPDAAWSFIQYMISPYAQKYIALKTSLIATLTSVYDDPEVLAKNPFFKSLKPILESAQPRPVSPKYADISSSIQLHIYQALKKQLSPVDALSSLQASLESIVAS